MNSSTFKTQSIIDYIVQWLKTYAQNAGVKGFVIGISGGIDSALVSTLCAETGWPTWCVELPIHQPENQVSRAEEHLQFLTQRYNNIHAIKTDLTSTFEQLRKELPVSAAQETVDLTLANTRARLRMTTLYYYAGLEHLLVVGTGNKVEDFGVGFFTKYGDGGVDLSPIADLMKSEVRLLAAFLDLPLSIRKAQPTDGLFGDDRSDEDQIGASYDELETAMLAYESGKTEADFRGRALEVFQIYKKRHLANVHKINPIPVCIIPAHLK